MWNVLLILASLATLGALFFRFLDEVWISDADKAAIQARFETWWLTLAHTDSRVVALALVTKVAQRLDVYFGPRLLSKLAAIKSFAIGTTLLGLTLGVVGLTTSRPAGLAPWQTFQETANLIDSYWSTNHPVQGVTPEAEAA